MAMDTALETLTSQPVTSSLPVTSSSAYWTPPWPVSKGPYPLSSPPLPPPPLPDALSLNATNHPLDPSGNPNPTLNANMDLNHISPTMSLSQLFDITAAPFAPSLSAAAAHPQSHPLMAPTMLADSSLSSLSSSSSSSPPSPSSFTSTDRYYATHGVPPGNPPPHQQHHHHPLTYPRQPWPSYSLPAMNGPVLTNIHNPNSHMSLLGGTSSPLFLSGFNSGHVASMQQMYHGPSSASSPHPVGPGLVSGGPAHDRPFKCDQCPQSFNRNHDLKRHKRIHLSVKPFPCTHCDKSFSRKDALKVCLLSLYYVLE